MAGEVISSTEKIRNAEFFVVETPEIAGLQSYEYLRSNAASQRDAFISGDQETLDLIYPDLGSEKIDQLAEKSRQTLIALMPGENSDKSEALYRSVEYRYSEMFLLSLAGMLQDPDLDETVRKETLEWFQITNDALYGAPSKKVFSALLRQKVLGKIQTPEDVETQQLVAELHELLGPLDEEEDEGYVPSSETIERINRLVRERFGGMVAHIEDDKTYSAQEMVGVIDIALDKIGAKELGWKVELTSDSSALAVSAHQKLVEVGENRKDSDGSELKGKVIHEVGIHALRSINALKADWLSAAYGQDGYLDFEEGVATALEDAYKGEFEDHGVDYYLIAGLARGLDNHAPRDFRETYEIMWRIGLLTEDEVKKAKTTAFNRCLRLYRGTSTREKGVIYSKDLSYFRGQELAWSVLDQIYTPEDFDLLLTGKLDLTRPDHLEIARKIQGTNTQIN